ncbi:ABC-type transport auxiliary lipoprotein family protein [Coraliomargarita algicola]|uniref:ABC-type transport auxiliary lipoprotein family protein n=1 Tax=Coraliomargarita algicola TaxID=3092156 RepID=A0ABZ0RNP8_9BACT|nr:ABC-type transport auxiliary lipoprotein family protein [Coraliomargarita sp. J2-16]WPJ96380.1 ABC-type transport auxiliary lipoprotein family protein [Coraliomargarita sp. J2-16]
MKIIYTIALSFVLLLSGCVNLKPKPDRTQIFTLASNVAAVAEVAGKPQCYVSRVELPGYLEGHRIYYRSGNGELSSVSGSRWAESPRVALPSAIAMHLQATGKVHVRAYYPWQNTASEGATISLQFERFSANAAGEVEVIAQWQITSADGSQREGRFIAPKRVWDRQDAADYVAQLDAALSSLAEVLAQEL